MDIIDTEGVVKFTAGLQQADGSFTGDKWGKYNALSMLNIVYLYTCGLFVCRWGGYTFLFLCTSNPSIIGKSLTMCIYVVLLLELFEMYKFWFILWYILRYICTHKYLLSVVFITMVFFNYWVYGIYPSLLWWRLSRVFPKDSWAACVAVKMNDK